MKYIISLGSVNYHIRNEEAFRFSSENDHFKCMKYIVELGSVDHHACDEYAFKFSSDLKCRRYIVSLDLINVPTYEVLKLYDPIENSLKKLYDNILKEYKEKIYFINLLPICTDICREIIKYVSWNKISKENKFKELKDLKNKF